MAPTARRSDPRACLVDHRVETSSEVDSRCAEDLFAEAGTSARLSTCPDASSSLTAAIRFSHTWRSAAVSNGTTTLSPTSAVEKHSWRERGKAASRADGENADVPTYTVNRNAVRHAKRLIDARQYVLRSRWQDVQPRAREQNAFLKAHSWEEYSAWHLGLTEGASEETKARFAFVYGDFRRLHRMGLIACHYRAAEWRHKEIELAAHELLQYLDRRIA
jgi:hypothetical protein